MGKLLRSEPGSKGLPIVRPPPIQLDDAKLARFAFFVDRAVAAGGVVPYDLDSPVHEFVRWLGADRDVLFHGAHGPARNSLDPIRSTSDLSRSGRQLAVYATPWPLWAMWFAVLNKRHRGFIYTINGSRPLADTHGDREYWFKVNARARTKGLLGDGTLYVVDRARFVPSAGEEPADEWVSAETVVPRFSLRIRPPDFPFSESILSR